jgi:hypothetical protein
MGNLEFVITLPRTAGYAFRIPNSNFLIRATPFS